MYTIVANSFFDSQVCIGQAQRMNYHAHIFFSNGSTHHNEKHRNTKGDERKNKAKRLLWESQKILRT